MKVHAAECPILGIWPDHDPTCDLETQFLGSHQKRLDTIFRLPPCPSRCGYLFSSYRLSGFNAPPPPPSKWWVAKYLSKCRVKHRNNVLDTNADKHRFNVNAFALVYFEFCFWSRGNDTCSVCQWMVLHPVHLACFFFPHATRIEGLACILMLLKAFGLVFSRKIVYRSRIVVSCPFDGMLAAPSKRLNRLSATCFPRRCNNAG